MKYLALSALLTLAACDSSDDGPAPAPPDGTGQGGAGGGQNQGEARLVWPAQTEADVVLVVPNLDDDNKNGTPDFEDPGRIEDNDLGHVQATVSGKAQLSFDGDASKIRVYKDGKVILGKGAEAAVEITQDGDAPVELAIEVAASGRLGTLSLGESSLIIQGVAPTMGHHLLPTETVWAVQIDAPEPSEGEAEGQRGEQGRERSGASNAAMLKAMREALGDKLVVLTQEDFKAAGSQPEAGGDSSLRDEKGPDPWAQDEFEMFGLWTPDAEAQLTMNSPRDGGLDPIVRRFLAPAVAMANLSEPRPQSSFDDLGETAPSQDYGGNLEVSPPVTVNGVEYPLGRIYYGAGPSEVVKNFLHGTEVQKPIVMDVSWLCVGHADEVVTFLPDPKAPQGFRMFVTDTTKGVEMIRGMDADLQLTRYPKKIHNAYGYQTPGEILNDAALLAYNERVQRDYIEPTIALFKRELGLSDEEIVRVPMMFYVLDAERAYGEGAPDQDRRPDGADDLPPGTDGQEDCAEALFPDTVNMLVVTNETGDGGLAVIPDPFLRTDESSQAGDPLIEFWKGAAPEGMKLLFVDDWQIYHLGGGEVHCGTNQTRQPALSTLESLDRWTRIAEEK